MTLKRFMAMGFGVTEIGKFSITSDDPKLRERATHMIEMAWLRMAPEDEIFIAHVTSRAHARLYKKYGFEIAEEFTVPGSQSPEMILWVRGWQFKNALRKHLNVHLFQASQSRAHKRALLPAESDFNNSEQ